MIIRMINFHEHKLWQEAFVGLMDIHEALEKLEIEPPDAEVARELIKSAEHVAATIADGLTRRDNRRGRELIENAVGEVAETRTHLAIAWGRGLLEDETFKKLDGQYDRLSSSLQIYR